MPSDPMKHSMVKVWMELDDSGREFIRYEVDDGMQIATVLGALSFAAQSIFLQQQYDSEAEDDE